MTQPRYRPDRHELEERAANSRCLDELRQIMEFRPQLIVDYDPEVHRAELVGN